MKLHSIHFGALALALWAAPAAAQDAAPRPPTATPFVVDASELAESRFGPRKDPAVYVAGERVWVRLLARSLGRDDRGDLALGVGVALDRPDDEVRTIETLRAPDIFSARAFPVAVSFPVPPGAPPGPHEVAIALEDRATGARRTLRAPIEIRALERGPVALNPYFAADLDGQVERPNEFRVGETIRLFFGVVALEPVEGKVRCEADLEVRDQARPLDPIAQRGRVLSLEGPAREGVPALEASFATTATAPGRFLLRIVVRDLNTRRQATVEKEVTVRP